MANEALQAEVDRLNAALAAANATIQEMEAAGAGAAAGGAAGGAAAGGDAPGGGANPPPAAAVVPAVLPAAEQPRRINANQLVLLKEFKGEEGEDVEVLLAQVDRGIQAFAWTEEQTASMVQTKLVDKAARWLRSALKTANPRRDDLSVWSNNGAVRGLRDNIIRRFKEGINERGAVEAVVDLNQKVGESVDEFHDRVVIAMDHKNYNVVDKDTDEYRQRLEADIFIFFGAGLKTEIRIQAMGGMNQPRTVEALLRAARNAELERKRQKVPKSILTLSEGSASERQACEAEEKTDGETLTLSSVAAQIDALKRQVAGRGKSQGKCFNCYQFGHYAAQCTAPPKQAGPGRGRGRGRGMLRGRGGRGNFGRGGFVNNNRRYKLMAIATDGSEETITVDADAQWVQENLLSSGEAEDAAGSGQDAESAPNA